MRYQITIRGISPLITHNGAAGLDPYSPANREKAGIAKKKGSNRTEADELRLRELECQTGLYLDDRGAPTIPAAVIRANIEGGARKRRQGPQVREGLVVSSIDKFQYDKTLGTTAEELGKTAQFTVGVRVQRSRILRTRPMFKEWGLTFTVEVDPELVDQPQLEDWLDIGGRRLGIGDWRPEKSGHYGRYEVESITPID